MAAYVFNSIDDATFEFNGRVFPRYFEVLNGTATGIAIKSVFTHEPFLSFNKVSEIEIDSVVYTEAQIVDALNALTEVVGFRMGGIGGAVVESVTGNLVDNTDPANPIVTGVEGVTGNLVDNADPFNPVVTGVETVTGNIVDNSDPANPVVTGFVPADWVVKSTQTNRYSLVSPPLNTEVDTLIDPVDYPNADNVSFAIVVNLTVSTNNYVLKETIPISTFVAFPDIRYARSSEFEGVGGDANMAFWYDSGTDSIHYECDLDGGGKTIAMADVTTSQFDLVLEI